MGRNEIVTEITYCDECKVEKPVETWFFLYALGQEKDFCSKECLIANLLKEPGTVKVVRSHWEDPNV